MSGTADRLLLAGDVGGTKTDLAVLGVVLIVSVPAFASAPKRRKPLAAISTHTDCKLSPLNPPKLVRNGCTAAFAKIGDSPTRPN